jgi:hypothetical protein
MADRATGTGWSQWRLPLLVGVALAVSSTGRFANPIGRGDEPGSDAAVWLGIIAGTVAYTLLVALVWHLVARLTPRRCEVALGLVVGAAVLAFLVVYPLAGRPVDASGYGDADDALNILADGFTEGFDPYERTTYEGNQLSPLMGSGLVAVPFRATMGSAAYQNPVWLVIAVLVLRRSYGARIALALTVPVLSSLDFAENYLLGGDYYISGIAVTLAAFAFVRAVGRSDWVPWGAAIALGILSANRVTTLPVLALVVATLFAARRLRPALGPLVVAGLVNLALWVPWWWQRPNDFPPLTRVDLIGPPIARGLALAILVGVLVWIAAGRWRDQDPGDPDERLQQGALLGLSGAPSVVWSPSELYRITSYLWFAVPRLATELSERLTSPAHAGDARKGDSDHG